MKPEIDKATPRPWGRGYRRWAGDNEGTLIICDTEGGSLGIMQAGFPLMHETQEANAELVVTAVNSYTSLREVCEAALSWVEANTIEPCSGHGPNPSQCLECHLRANGKKLSASLRAVLEEVEPHGNQTKTK